MYDNANEIKHTRNKMMCTSFGRLTTEPVSEYNLWIKNKWISVPCFYENYNEIISHNHYFWEKNYEIGIELC